MVAIAIGAVVSILVSFALSSPLHDLGPHAVFQKRQAPAAGWTHEAAPHAAAMVNMHIGLKHSNVNALHAKLLDISNPRSPNYGRWLSKEEMEGHTSPIGNATSLVKKWLASDNIVGDAVRQSSPDWLSFEIPVSQAEDLLKTKYMVFRNEQGHRAVGTLQYSVPQQLHGLIDTIQPTTALHGGRRTSKAEYVGHTQISKRAPGQPCPDDVTVDCIRSYYNVDCEGKGGQQIAVTGFLGLSASHADAAVYLKTNSSRGAGSDFKDVLIGNDTHPNIEASPSLEGNLDTQIALAVGFPSTVSYLMVGPNNQADPTQFFGDELIPFAQWLNTVDNPPTVVSTSYVQDESDLDDDYKDRLCNEFMKAGARGITVLFSSGDNGVSGTAKKDSCPNGFVPVFPASCPYVTAVGGTQFNGTAEAASLFEDGGATGGGFSRHFKAPSYQMNDTASYISKLPPSINGTINKEGRGIPDVSLISVNWDVIVNGTLNRLFGTSASAPAWGSLVSLINDYRQTLGKGPVGFINPALYGDPDVRAALRDVVGGSNRGCGGDGLPATEGWDAATGLGSMDFAALRQAFGKLGGGCA